MNTSRRNFSLGLAAFGLSACSTGGVTARGPAANTGLPADLRPQRNAGYDAWVASFKARAGGKGISQSTLTTAL